MHFSGHQPRSAGDSGSCPDPLAREQIYEQYLEPIYRFLYARVGNREDAEDLTSQVFLKAFRLLDVERPERSIACWVFTVARTVLSDHWRQAYRYGSLADLDEDLPGQQNTLDPSADREKVQRVEEALARLPARARAVLELRFLRGYSVEETAGALGITSGNVKVIQHRALARAADLMGYRVAPGSPCRSDHRAIA